MVVLPLGLTSEPPGTSPTRHRPLSSLGHRNKDVWTSDEEVSRGAPHEVHRVRVFGYRTLSFEEEKKFLLYRRRPTPDLGPGGPGSRV